MSSGGQRSHYLRRIRGLLTSPASNPWPVPGTIGIRRPTTDHGAEGSILADKSSRWAGRRRALHRRWRLRRQQSDGSLGRLLVTRRRVRWGLVLLVLLTVAVAAYDLGSREARPPAVELLFDLAYGAIISIL